eukprot:1839249-Prymnesium_polylepis.1
MERSPGTWTASQLPTGTTPKCLAIGSDGIGPSESRCTTDVWYVSEVFCIRNFQLQLRGSASTRTNRRRYSPDTARHSPLRAGVDSSPRSLTPRDTRAA